MADDIASSPGLCTSPIAALAGCLVLCATYVGCLYVGATNNGRAPNRNDPRVIKQRFLRVAVASMLAPGITLAAAALPGGRSPCTPDAPLISWFGLASPPPRLALAAMLPLLLTMVLFLGPLIMEWLDRDPHTTLVVQTRQFCEDMCELTTVRNLIVGPLTEEWVFRACMCPLLFGAGFGDAANVFTSGAIFGLAHVHHVYDAGASWLAVGVQFTYTTLFGAYSSYLFLRTGSLVGPVLAHAFCNLQGLPNFARVPHHPRAQLVGAAFVVGLAGFTALVLLDAVYRPALFLPMLWHETTG
jgi:prenyl protein peptidase